MEPLVVFGAGLVIYCGYLAAMDEIRVFKGYYAKRMNSRRARVSKTAKGCARPVSAKGGAYAGNSGMSCVGRILLPQVR